MSTIKKFGAEWCQPCHKLNPLLDELNNEFDFLTVEHYDVDDMSPEELQEYSISSVPVMFIYDDEGVLRHRINGVVSRQEIVESING